MHVRRHRLGGIRNVIPVLAEQTVPRVIHLGTWISVAGFHVEWALRYDTLSVVMVAMVTFVATLIHIYSVGYMAHDETVPRVLQLSEPVHLRDADVGDGR